MKISKNAMKPIAQFLNGWRRFIIGNAFTQLWVTNRRLTLSEWFAKKLLNSLSVFRGEDHTVTRRAKKENLTGPPLFLNYILLNCCGKIHLIYSKVFVFSKCRYLAPTL